MSFHMLDTMFLSTERDPVKRDQLKQKLEEDKQKMELENQKEEDKITTIKYKLIKLKEISRASLS